MADLFRIYRKQLTANGCDAETAARLARKLADGNGQTDDADLKNAALRQVRAHAAAAGDDDRVSRRLNR